MGKPPAREAKAARPNFISGLVSLGKPHHRKIPGLVSINYARRQIFHLESSGTEALIRDAWSVAALLHEVTTSRLIFSG